MENTRSEVNKYMIWKIQLLVFLSIIYLPTKLLKYAEYFKLKYELNKIEKEIEVLEKEILSLTTLDGVGMTKNILNFLNKWTILPK